MASLTSSTSDRDPLERLADEFLERRRRGEHPALSEYAEKHPELAEQIFELFPALEVMEGLKPSSEDGTAARQEADLTALAGRPERLGEYRILREIGKGGMGVVYEAIQESLGRRVALKILPFHGRVDPVQIERFRLESRSAARLHHGHIVPVHGMGEHDGVYYYAMQYIQGHGLDAVLADLRRLRGGSVPEQPAEEGSVAIARSLLTGRLGAEAVAAAGGARTRTEGPDVEAESAVDPPSRPSSSVLSQTTETGYHRAVARLGVDIARALAHAHGQGVLHRDIKPSNLLLDMNGHVWVTDFGLAKLEGSEGPTQSGDIVGTLRYMAPERFEGWSDRRGDIYGLGMTLYEMLTLHPAFNAVTRAKLIDQVIHDPPPALRRVDPSVPRDLETIVLKAIAKEPAERYPTAEALASDLESYLADRPIAARRATAAEQAWRWCRRNKAAAGFLVASAAAILTGVGLLVALSYQSRLRTAHGEAERQRGIAEAALESERAFLYTNRILFAQRELGDHNPHRAEQLLEECPAEHRGWEWNYLKRQCHPELLQIEGHRANVFSVAFSADGRRLVTAGGRSVRVWDAETGRLLTGWDDHPQDIEAIALSPDGHSVVVCDSSLSRPRPAQVRDPATGKLRRTIGSPLGSHSNVALSPDGRRVALASGDLTDTAPFVQVCDLHDGRIVRTFTTPNEATNSPCFSPDGRCLLATAGAADYSDSGETMNRGVVWDIDSGRELFSLHGHTAPLMSAAYNPDGLLIAASGYDSIVRLHDTRDGRILRVLEGHRNCVNRVAFSPDGSRLASASDDNSVIVWEAATGRVLDSLSGHEGGVFGLTYDPNGQRLATGGYDGRVKIWDVERTKGPRVFSCPTRVGRIFDLAVSPSGDLLAAACGDATVKLWDLPEGKFRGTLKGHRDVVWGIAFSRDGRWLASAAGDWRKSHSPGEIFVWEVRTLSLHRRLEGHGGIAWAVDFSPDGTLLASGGGELHSPDESVILWDLASGRRLRTIPFPEGGSRCVAFHPAGDRVTAGTVGMARTWRITTGEPVQAFLGHTDTLHDLAYNISGSRLATSSTDLSIRIWDPDTGAELVRSLGNSMELKCITFSPDDRRIISVGNDQRLTVWDSATGQQLVSLASHSSVLAAVAISRDGHMIYTGDYDGLVKAWDGSPLPSDRP